MEFKEFKQLHQQHMAKMFNEANTLFFVKADNLWETYLDSFPAGTNEVFRERREYDCACCRHFIHQFGNVVTIENGKIISIWDFEAPEQFGPVCQALSNAVHQAQIEGVFVTKENSFGADINYEIKGELVTAWHHFFVKLPKKLVYKGNDTVARIQAQRRDIYNVFIRSLEEISPTAVETVLDLISQNSLYRGEEWQSALEVFLSLQKQYQGNKVWAWQKSVEVGPTVGKIKNHSIGVLLTDISQEVELNEAVRRYEAIVAPTNYKRPKAIFTPKMVEQAKAKITELGFLDSLPRRFATVQDITINNVLWANRSTKQKWDVFEELGATVNPKHFDKVQEMSADDFVANILPRATNLEVMVENQHTNNLMSVIAPQNPEAPTMFKWGNNFSWAYNGNIAASMKERVKRAGGNVEGVIRFSLQWNEDGQDNNDLDAHCYEPYGNLIYYGCKKNPKTTGVLDVDIIEPKHQIDNNIAVENITWSNEKAMNEGEYFFKVHCFSYRGGRGGFRAEIECNGKVYSYNYPQPMRQNERISVARVSWSRKDGLKIIESLPAEASISKEVWGIKTHTFTPVTMCMFSPNYWDDKTGHRHLFFILEGCKNDTLPNGFFNEFLIEDLMSHKRVFEALGSKMKVDPSEQQLSGLGFSLTQSNSVMVKVEGHTSRFIKINF